MMKIFFKRLVATILTGLLAAPNGAVLAMAAQAGVSGVVSFESLEVSSDQVSVQLSGSAKYNSFLTSSPPRLVVELLNTEYQAGAKVVEGQGRYLKRVRSGQFERSPRMVARIVIDLKEVSGYRINEQPKGLLIQLVKAEETVALKSDSEHPVVSAPKVAAEPKAAAKVEPKAAPKMEAKAEPKAAPAVKAAPVVAAAAEPKAAAKVEPKAAPKVEAKAEPKAAPAVKAVPVVAAAAEPKVAPKIAPSVASVATPAAMAVTLPKITPKAVAAQPLAAAVDDKGQEPGSMSTANSAELTAMAAPDPEKAEKAAASQSPASSSHSSGAGRAEIMSRLTRDLVTLDFDNMDIRDIIKLLAAKAKVNIIYGSDVSGTLTLHLADVPFNEAFRTILSMMGLTTVQVGDNILRILTPGELAKSRTTSAAVTKVVPLNYSKASELATAVNAVRTAEGRNGTTSADVKTNSLIITEPLEGLAATERLIAQLDVRPKQVLIEAKLIEVGLNNSLHYGIQWDYLSSERAVLGGQQGTNLVGTLTHPQSSNSPALPPLDNNLNAVPGVGSAGRGTGVSLPASTVFGALTLGRITNNYFLSATLTAAAAQGKVKVLSDPKIATLNNQPATINVTTSIPYVTSNVASTGVQTQSVAYVVTGIKLAVTPTINADGRITLDINPDVSQPSATAAASTTGAPAVDARNAKTVVLVKDGETIVIGGLISDSVSNQVAKVPILGDIPILGWLFRKKSVVRTRSELLIFVTPKILPD